MAGRFRFRTRWPRVTPLRTYPLLRRPAATVFQHHDAGRLPANYAGAVARLVELERAWRRLKRQRREQRNRLPRVDRVDVTRARRRMKRQRRAVLAIERAYVGGLEAIAINRDFLGISYSIVAFPLSGHLWKGRGLRRVGAHTLGWNERAVAIVAAGNFDVDDVDPMLREGIARALARGRRLGRIVAGYAYRPHSDVSATRCPGDHLRAAMPLVHRRAKELSR